MDAALFLVEIGRQLRTVNLDAVLIGNAAAALQGAPVTTVDFDFMFRKASRNMRKLNLLASNLNAVIFQPYYPARNVFVVTRDDGCRVMFTQPAGRSRQNQARPFDDGTHP